MKIGVFSALFYDKNFKDMLNYALESRLDMTEAGTGGNSGDKFCRLDELLEDEDKRQVSMKPIIGRGLQISGFSCHNNPISPDPIEAKEADEILRKTIRLANLLDVPVVNTFSGIAGSDDTARKPNWPVTSWPAVYSEVYDHQWNEKLMPYRQDLAEFAKEQDVKIAIELHAGSLVHTSYTILKLHEATNEYIGTNLDPSHLWWQGIDPIAAIRILGQASAIHHFHAKDTYINQEDINMYGLADMQPYGSVATRAWTFHTVGHGRGPYIWTDIISQLTINGYDCALGTEHKDPIMPVEEGFQKACQILKSVSVYDKPADMWWA